MRSALRPTCCLLRAQLSSLALLLLRAGLIFLSAMATSIAQEGAAEGDSPAEIVGTTLVTLAIATTLVGICIIFVGASLPFQPSSPSHDALLPYLVL